MKKVNNVIIDIKKKDIKNVDNNMQCYSKEEIL